MQMQKHMMSLGKHLKKARKEAGLTQEQLAERAGVSRAAVARYESGEIEPSLKTLVSIADTLNVSTDSLLGRESALCHGLSCEAEAALRNFIAILRREKVKNSINEDTI